MCRPTILIVISSVPTYPSPGIRVHQNQHGATVLRLHYDADPRKGSGEKVFVPEINRHLSPWAYQQYTQMTDSNAYLREYEIEAEATLGQLIFSLDETSTLEPSFPIPPHWTRRMSLDPHPSVPHAFLWCATDPWGDRWYYRELWPSKVCYRYDGAKLTGKPGPCADDEPIMRIRDYVETIHWLESAENPENFNQSKEQPFEEQITARVIDYAARAFGQGTNDDPEQPNFQQRYEMYMILPEFRVSCPSFDDAQKDRDVGFEIVNSGLRPRMVMGNDGEPRKRSTIHIFKDRCPELIYQLKNNRRQQLTATQAQTKDPTGKAVPVRTHMTDNLRYLEMSHPTYIRHDVKRPDWQPVHRGIAY